MGCPKSDNGKPASETAPKCPLPLPLPAYWVVFPQRPPFRAPRAAPLFFPRALSLSF
ncbi:MAG: hypothetical protein RJA70_803 [Pseudomonadota bacterium]|jgi:hypothetical protein